MSDGIRCMWMRRGTSKGGFFLSEDLPADAAERDAVLLRIMGSPDLRQIDGMGGADPLTSEVAVVKPSTRSNVDVDYLFLQVFVDQPIVTDAQNCGSILAGVGPFAIERGIVLAEDGETAVRISMENTGQIAIARIPTPGGHVPYDGDARIDGVPGTASAVPIEFQDTAGSTCGALLPICKEHPTELEAHDALRRTIESIRLQAGPMMNLDDVEEKSVPKMTMVSAPQLKGALSTRTFIPHRCHKSIGVLDAVSVATACLTSGAVGSDLATLPEGQVKKVSIEHPSGEMTVMAHLDADGVVARTEVLRTARKLMDGAVFP